MGAPILSTGTLGLDEQCGAGNPSSLGGTFTPEISLLILNHVGVGPASFVFPPLLIVLTWLLLYILSFRTSVKIVFRWFFKVIAL